MAFAWLAERKQRKQEINTLVILLDRFENAQMELDHFQRLNAAGISTTDVLRDSEMRLDSARGELANVCRRLVQTAE